MGKFVHYIEGSLYRKPQFNKILKKKNKQYVCYIEVQLIINFQHPAFPDLTNVYNKHLYTKLLSQFRAAHSYGTRNTRTGKQNCLKLLYTKVLSSLVCFAFPFSCPSLGRMLTFSFLISRYILHLCFRIVFVITRISNFCSIHFIVILAGLKKIICYTEDFFIIEVDH